MKDKTISKQVGKADQDAMYVEILSLAPEQERELVMLALATNPAERLEAPQKRVKVEIRSNFYVFQSYARISAWDEKSKQWHTVHALLPSSMKTPPGLASRDFLDEKLFLADRAELLRVAHEVLS